MSEDAFSHAITELNIYLCMEDINFVKYLLYLFSNNSRFVLSFTYEHCISYIKQVYYFYIFYYIGIEHPGILIMKNWNGSTGKISHL